MINTAVINHTKNYTISSAASAADQVIKETLETGNVAQTYAQVRWVQEVLELVMRGLQKHVMEKPPTDTYHTGGMKLEVHSRREYEYTHDAAWREAQQTEKVASETRKVREKFLQALTEPLADPNTGELIEPARLLAMKPYIRCTIPK